MPTAALTLFSDGGVLSSQWETFLGAMTMANGRFAVNRDFDAPKKAKKKKQKKKNKKKKNKKRSSVEDEDEELSSLPFLVCNGLFSPLRDAPPPLEHAFSAEPFLPCARKLHINICVSDSVSFASFYFFLHNY